MYTYLLGIELTWCHLILPRPMEVELSNHGYQLRVQSSEGLTKQLRNPEA